jgi:5-methylcytosine-specific restriction endonuclease McrA
MPIDYSKYATNWKTEIRPAILERAGHCCEKCNVPNYVYIFRGFLEDGTEVYQDAHGYISDANDSSTISEEDFETVIRPLSKDKAIKVVLTIAHLDHDITNNDHSNLMALCQRCHNRHDAQYRKGNRAKVKNQLNLL